MKQLIALLILCVSWFAQAAAPIGTNTSAYPNTNVAPASALILLAVTNETPRTNYNMLISDFLRQATNTAAITNYTFITNAIQNISNYIAASGLLSLLTNGVSVTALMTNLNLLYGTGMVMRATNASGDVAVQVSAEVTQAGASVIASNAANSLNLWTNNNGFIQTTTNRPVSIPNTNLVGGLVITQDIRFLGHNSSSNSLWACTNGTTGEGEWRTADQIGLSFQTNLLTTSNFLATSSIDVKTNQISLILQSLPNSGSQWFVGTNGTPQTFGARQSMEFNTLTQSVRWGALGNQGVDQHIYLRTSNFWDAPNLGFMSWAFGSNTLVNAIYSSVAGGVRNIIYTNADYSTIGGGFGNAIHTNSSYSTIGGGGNATSGNTIQVNSGSSTISGGGENVIQGGSPHCTIGGGQANLIRGGGNSFSTIGGGLNNHIDSVSSGNSDRSVIAGGDNNVVRGKWASLGGGRQNTFHESSDFSVIGGGDQNVLGQFGAGVMRAVIGGGANNTIDASATYSVIGGGFFNVISGANTNSAILGGFDNFIDGNAPASAILSGRRNRINVTGDYGTIPGGLSNVVSAAYAWVIGDFGTNADAKTILLSFERVKVKNPSSQAASNAVVGGRIWQEVGGLYTNLNAAGTMSNLATVSIAAHQMTNLNDQVEADWGLKLRNTTVSSNQFQLFFGSTTLLDTGLQSTSNNSVRANCVITRTGNTSAHVEASLYWGPGTAPFAFTNANIEIAETNGIATTLGIKGGASAVGSHTNNYFRVKWAPAAL